MDGVIRLSCVLSADELAGRRADIVVLPEGVAEAEIERVAQAAPHAIVVGAVERRKRSAAVLKHDGINRVEYVKMGSDGRTLGANAEPRELPVFLCSQAAVGAVICMDVQQSGWVRRIIDALAAAAAPIKLLCIPADMSGDYFQGERLQPYLHGVHVALCNHVRSYPNHRCASFVTDAAGAKRVVQQGATPLHVELLPG